jgi:hypothetical protein
LLLILKWRIVLSIFLCFTSPFWITHRMNNIVTTSQRIRNQDNIYHERKKNQKIVKLQFLKTAVCQSVGKKKNRSHIVASKQ